MSSSDFPRFSHRPWIFPAIDLRGGRVVRLLQGAAEAETRYGDDPLEFARRWVEAGSDCLHIIDLGGAFREPDSLDHVLQIAGELRLPIQVGGGLRDEAMVARLLDGGVSRVILGTRALQDPAFLDGCIEKHGSERVVLAMDLAGGRVKISGWTEDSSLDLAGGIDFAVEHGVSVLLLTAIDRDGTLSGASMPLVEEALERAREKNLLVVVAGGIGKLDDIQAVLDLRSDSLQGVVVGRALYEKTVELTEALELARRYQG